MRCKKNGYILGAGSISSTLADREILDTGLVFGASYTIYDAKQVSNSSLLLSLDDLPTLVPTVLFSFLSLSLLP